MSYSTIWRCATDSSLIKRVTAAAAAEGASDPTTIVATHLIWPLATDSGVEAAYASALAAGNPDPGGDEAVITDGMILASVQANMPPPEVPDA